MGRICELCKHYIEPRFKRAYAVWDVIRVEQGTPDCALWHYTCEQCRENQDLCGKEGNHWQFRPRNMPCAEHRKTQKTWERCRIKKEELQNEIDRKKREKEAADKKESEKEAFLLKTFIFSAVALGLIIVLLSKR